MDKGRGKKANGKAMKTIQVWLCVYYHHHMHGVSHQCCHLSRLWTISFKIKQHQAAPKHLWGTCALVVQMVPPASLANHHLRMSLLSSLRSIMLIRHCCGAADPEAAAWILFLLGHRTQASAGSTSVPGRSPSRSSLRSCRDKRRRMKNEPIGKGFFLVVLDCGQ